jgi:hypothetical protein
MAFVQAAVYNAVVGIEGRYEPYRFHAHAPRGASAQAAAVAAAHQVLVTYSPYAQADLDQAYAASLAQIPDGKAKTRGIAFGTRAAEHLIRLRAHDGRNAPIEFTRPPAPGVWRPTPPGLLPMSAPWLGFVTPLLARSATQFAPPSPPALTSARYTRDFNEVKALGSATSTERTPAQTDTARFFSGSALVQYNAALRDQVRVRDLDIVDAARMFAAVDMSVADSIISVWHAKYVYGYWRPIMAINLAATDGNPATVADPTWTPLLVTPPYPDYPSGYNVVNATVSQGIEDVFRTRHLRLTLISTAVPGVQRFYDSAGRCGATSSTPGCGWGSTSASPTPPPGTWAGGSPPGPSTTTSSRSTGTEERNRPAAGSGPRTGWLSDRPPSHQRRRHSVAVPPVRLRLHLRMQVHQVQPQLVRVGREMRAVGTRLALGHPGLLSDNELRRTRCGYIPSEAVTKRGRSPCWHDAA